MDVTNYEALEYYITTISATKYAERRNYIGESTRLSEFITRGVISLPRVKELILKNNSEQSAYKLLNELAWREYWQQTWRVRGDEIFSSFRTIGSKLEGIPTSILNASTGIAAIDAGLSDLYDTGYIHNHMRLWLAGVICNIAQCNWRVGADWMISHLIDGDYASNHLSWQWCAGAYTGKQYLPQQDNINTFSKSVQHNTFLDASYEAISVMPIPNALAELTEPAYTLAKQAKLPSSINTVSIHDLVDSDLQLYSPWTLDPNWKSASNLPKVLVLGEPFFDGHFSQNVLDSILKFSTWVPDIKILKANSGDLKRLNGTIYRKDHPVINDWPGVVSQPELLFPNITQKFYPSFSSFWKQAQK
ncbi:hypothetical protein H7171_02190 [Candidatus Saccharibacteria bacterium]|nr:hypothetical protein [Candidatus Saccharibacteria bacterium]